MSRMRGRGGSVQEVLAVRLKNYTETPRSYEASFEWMSANVQGKTSESIVTTSEGGSIFIDLEEVVEVYTHGNLLADVDDFDTPRTPRLVYIPSADTLTSDRLAIENPSVNDTFYSGWFYTSDVRPTYRQYKGGDFNKATLQSLSSNARVEEIGYASDFLEWHYFNVGNPLVEHPQPSSITNFEIAVNNLSYVNNNLVTQVNQ